MKYNTFHAYALKHGKYGNRFAATQLPYLAGTQKQPCYKSHAIDIMGNEYELMWQIKDDYDATEKDESDACDWNDFKFRAL